MPAFVYILRSDWNGRFYVGWTGDIDARLRTHNAGQVKATRNLRPWTLVYTEELPTPTDARKREWYLKRMKSHVYLQALVEAG
jgi:putative endonuclease